MNQNQYPAAGLASLLAAQGRRGDSMLVHMTPDEVRALQDMARSQGVDLPLNPVTGLPEASFLRNFLTTIGRGIQTVATTAIQNPQLTSLLVGGAYGAVKGDLSKGLDAGMKAYAGAQLLGGLAQAGQAARTRREAPRYSQDDIKAARDYAESVGLGDEAARDFLSQIKPTVSQPVPQSQFGPFADIGGGLMSVLTGQGGQGGIGGLGVQP